MAVIISPCFTLGFALRQAGLCDCKRCRRELARSIEEAADLVHEELGLPDEIEFAPVFVRSPDREADDSWYDDLKQALRRLGREDIVVTLPPAGRLWQRFHDRAQSELPACDYIVRFRGEEVARFASLEEALELIKERTGWDEPYLFEFSEDTWMVYESEREAQEAGERVFTDITYAWPDYVIYWNGNEDQ